MKYKTKLWLSTLLVTMTGAMFAPERAAAQQPAANAVDQLTAPIALYPDAIVIQILTASKNFSKVELFAAWLEKNSALKGTELQDAAQKAGFDTALVALAPFPQVVKMMVEKPDWTKALGQAVTTDKKAVADSIQRLRAQAQAAGNLKTTPQQVVTVTNVIVEKTVEQQVVVVTNTIIQIQPANPQVIYVPTYNPTVVYVQSPPSYTASAALVGFTVGVIVANNSYYHHRYDDYWDDREDYYEDRRNDAQANQDERQANSQERQGERQSNQDERQTGRQENQGSAQSQGAAKQTQRQTAAPATQQQGAAGQGQRQAAAPAASSQPARQSAGTTSTWGGGGAGSTASRSSGASSGTSYQSGSATRSQSSRGSSSMSSSRSSSGRSAAGGRSSGGGRSGGGGGRR